MADEWLQRGVEVDVRSLSDFATSVQSLLDDFRDSMATGVTPLLEVRPKFGAVVKEGAYLRESHDMQVEAAQYMLQDVMLGLTALWQAALAIGSEYIMGDAMTQATVEDVRDTFTAILLANSAADAPPATDDPPATDGEATDETSDEDPPLPEDAGRDNEPPELDGSGRYIAEGTPGEYWISADDERLYGDDVPDKPQS